MFYVVKTHFVLKSTHYCHRKIVMLPVWKSESN